MTKKVYIVNPDPAYVRMFEGNGWKVVETLQDADLVQFTGGEDVTPKLYGRKQHPLTYNNPLRDERETEIFLLARDKSKGIAGICRGGQFLNVMCGGGMYQHTIGHTIDFNTGVHRVIDFDTHEQFLVSSTHHQMMKPTKGARVILVAQVAPWVEDTNSVKDEGELRISRIKDLAYDYEALWYPHNNTFCFQPHPEFYRFEELGKRYIAYLDKYLFQ